MPKRGRKVWPVYRGYNRGTDWKGQAMRCHQSSGVTAIVGWGMIGCLSWRESSGNITLTLLSKAAAWLPAEQKDLCKLLQLFVL